ncbi:MAG: cytochrome c oxidase assembly protein [Candidatus Binatia bacterium]
MRHELRRCTVRVAGVKRPVTVMVLSAVLLLNLLATATWGHSGTERGALTRWDWRLDVLLVVTLCGAIYSAGWVRLRTRYPRIAPRWQLGLYLGALGAICLALVSPIDALADDLLSMHVVQHLLLLMIGPLFFLLANPLPASLWGLPTSLRHRIGHLLARHSLLRRALKFSTLMPVAWTFYVINLWAWHHPSLYQAALRDQWVHDIQHLSLFFTALFFWWPIANPAPKLHRAPSSGFRIVYLIAATAQNTLLGMAIALPERVLYPFYAVIARLRDFSPINDQALGGGLMWVSGHMYLIPILVLVARMLHHEEQPSLRK